MGKVIASIPADREGNILWIKDFREEKDRMFLKYKSTFNGRPFEETEIYSVDGGANLAITGGDGTIIYRFSVAWVGKLIEGQNNEKI